jgi:hypothetical protein
MPEPQSGIQGESGGGRDQGREGEKTLIELAEDFGVHPNEIKKRWLGARKSFKHVPLGQPELRGFYALF